MRRWLLTGCAAALLSCSTDKPAPPPLPLDVPLAPGQARAGRVTKASELIGGPIAYGRVGQVWKLYNAKARFLIQDVGAAVGLDLYGGNLIDADLVRAGDDGSNGNDLFREMFPIIGLHAMKPSSIEVISDGTGGGSAILRVHGTDAPSDILPQLDVLAQDLGGDVTLDYELAPDVPYLKITTTYHAAPGQSLTTLGLGDFLSFGASSAIISPENGFTGASVNVSFLGTSSSGSSYGYVYPGGNISIPIVDASGTACLLISQPVPVDGSESVSRYLVVGGGDSASVSGPMYALRGIATAALTGTVKDQSGATVADARVTLFRAPYSASEDCVDQAKSGSDGGYRFDLPPGDYVAIAGGVGRLHGAETAVTLGAAGTTLDVPVGGLGTVGFDVGEVSGGARSGVPAKLSFEIESAESPDPRFGNDPTESERLGLGGVALTPSGQGSLSLKPGTYRATVSRGPEYELAVIDPFVVSPGQSTSLKVDLQRVVDTTNFLAGDFHQHSQGSIDSPVPIRERVTEDLAEGIEFPAATDHDNVTDFRPHIAALGAQKFINAVVGNEVSVNGIGHFNGYPYAVDASDPYAKVGAQYWARLSIADLATKVHGEANPIVFHVSHPRTKQLAGWFNTVKFDPTTGKSATEFPIDGFDAVEVNGDLGDVSLFTPASDAKIHASATQTVPSGVPALRDWFALLNLGKPTCALGNSDTHFRNGGTGWPRTYVLFGTDDPQAATGAQLVTAIQAQHATVSNGPFVTVTLNGQKKMGHGEPVAVTEATAQLGIQIQAASWVDVTSFEVYANGRPLSLVRDGMGGFTQRPDGEAGSVLTMALQPGDLKDAVHRLDAQVTVTPARDTWYVVVVRGQKSLMPVNGGAPYAYTNPVYLDLGGDGWTAPGL